MQMVSQLQHLSIQVNSTSTWTVNSQCVSVWWNLHNILANSHNLYYWKLEMSRHAHARCNSMHDWRQQSAASWSCASSRYSSSCKVQSLLSNGLLSTTVLSHSAWIASHYPSSHALLWCYWQQRPTIITAIVERTGVTLPESAGKLKFRNTQLIQQRKCHRNQRVYYVTLSVLKDPLKLLTFLKTEQNI